MTNPTSKTPLLPVVRVLVWDAPLRVCHALMVACFTGTYLTGEQEEWRKVHATLGCTLGGLMVFRIIWGFVGTRYARFTNFLEAPGGIAKQLRQLPHGLAQRHIGLSPVGTLCYVILLLSMIGVGASGWATSGAAADDWLNALHEVAANVTLAVGGLYIAGVALSSWRAGDSPVLSHDPWNQAGLARRGHAKRETEWPCCWWQRLLPSGGINGRTSPRPVLQPPVTSPIPSRPRPKSAAGNTATILRRANTPGAERHILCMKWGTKYGPEYVNRLYAMVRRHLSGDFRFVCLTDDAQGIRPEVQCLPIPPLDLPAGIPERGWTKLVTFSADLHGLRGTALFLDVDVVIVGSLDAFFEHPGEFLIIHDYKRPWRLTGNSSVYRFELGAHPNVLEHFRSHFAKVRSAFRNEQAYLSDFIHRECKLTYWPDGWCPSFKYHCIPAWPGNYLRAPFVPPAARIVIFHGECNPPDALAGRRNRALRFIEPAAWVAEHWKE